MMTKKILLLIFTFLCCLRISFPQDLYNFDLHFSDEKTEILLDVDEESSVKVFVDVTGKTPEKLTLEVSYDGIIGLPKFMYWKFPNNNIIRDKKSIYNRFIISTFIETLLKYNYGTGVYELIFTAKAFNNRDIVVGSKTVKFKVIIAPAILSEHKVAKGSQNVIKWIDSDNLEMAIVNANDMTTSTLVGNLPNVLNKLNQNKIRYSPFDGLVPGHTYQYYIESFSKTGQKISSTPHQVKQDGIVPPQVLSLSSKNAPDGEIILSWEYPQQDTVYDLKGFYIFREKGTGEINLIDSLEINQKNNNYEYIDSPENGLKNAEYYSYRVSAYDSVFNISDGKITDPQLCDNEAPEDPFFHWDEDSYEFKDESKPDSLGDTGFPILHYKKGLKNVVKLKDPNADNPQLTFEVDSVRFQWVRDHSHFLESDPMDPGIQNRYVSLWKSVKDLLSVKFLIDTLLFKMDKSVEDIDVDGHIFKYAAQYKDKAGNVSFWSRVDQNDRLVGAIQDVFPPEKVTILKSVVESFANNYSGFVNLQWEVKNDQVSGLGKFYIYRTLFNHDSLLKVKTDIHKKVFHDTLNTDLLGRADYAKYWILPEDRVGNVLHRSNVVPTVVKYKVGPKINYVDNRKAFKDTFMFSLYYDSDILLDRIEVFVDGKLDSVLNLTTTPITEIIEYPLKGIDGKIFNLFVRARYEDGDVSINSNKLYPIKDILFNKPGWFVHNDSTRIKLSIHKKFVEFPTISIFDIDNDIDSIYITTTSNVTENSQIPNLDFEIKDTLNFCGIAKFNLKNPLFAGDTMVFQDTCKYPLEFFDYQLTIVDSAGNRWTSEQTKSGFGVIQPLLCETRYDKTNEEIHFELKYHKELFNEDINLRNADFRLRRFKKFHDPSKVDIDTISGEFPDRWGPVKTDEFTIEGDSVKIRGVWNNVATQENGERKKYFVYALLYWKDQSRHTRADVDSVDASLKIDLQTLLPKLIDQPDYGRIWINWTLDGKGIPPDIFRVYRIIDNDTIIIDTTAAFMDTFTSEEKVNLTYTIVSGLKLLKGEIFWSQDDTTVTIWDTRRAFIPFFGFPTDDPKKYLPLNNQKFIDHDSVFVHSDTLTLCWNWDSSKPNSENNYDSDVGQIRLQVDDDLNFSSPIDTSISDRNIIINKKYVIPNFNSRRELNFPQNGDSLFVRITAKDVHFNDSFIIWLDTSLAIIDNEPPFLPSKIVNFPSPGYNADTERVNMNIHWNTPSEISGIRKYVITCENIFEKTLAIFELSQEKNQEEIEKPPMFFWKIAQTELDPDLYLEWNIGESHKYLNRLMLINVEYKNNSKVQISIEDSLGNIRIKNLDKSNILFPITLDPSFDLEMKVVGSDTLLFWNPILSEHRNDFLEYFINYIDNKSLLGWPVSNPIHKTEVNDTSYNINGKAYNNYFHILARFKYGDLTNVTTWSKVVSSVDIQASTRLISDIQDNFVIIPEEYKLHQNFPNPFNPKTSITYDLPKQDHVTIKIYDVFGREIKTLIDKDMSAGRYQAIWDGKNSQQMIVSSGIYFIVFQTKEFISSKKCIFVK